jgi:hypothetical protein
MHYPTTITSPGGMIEVSVVVGARPLALHRRPDGLAFAAGAPGRAYALHVRNLTSSRIEAIVTVDGRHVLKDEPGDPHACRGIVLHAYCTYEFQGWRVSDEETREFLFGEPAAAAAAQATGSTSNVGVIGFAAWRERQTSYRLDSGILRGSAPVAYASAGFETRSMNTAETRSGSLGTGIGASQDDRVGRTDFTRDGSEPDILVVGYDTEAELIRRGIIGPADPDPFPGARTGYEKYAASK